MGLAFGLPFLVVPALPDRLILGGGWNTAMQGPAFALGAPLLVLLIQGLRLWNGDD